ncbi:TPA: hypothetical protein RK221_003969 [Escherichia coli]|nr:hypothetical protein [Escherichia coli]
MTELTKEQLIEEAKLKIAIAKCHTNSGMARVEGELFKIALASLEAEPVASCIIEDGGMCVDGFGEYVGHSLPDGTHQLYAAPPAPVVPEADPVAWTDEEELRDVKQYGLGEIFQYPPDKYADSRRVIPLYRVPPASIVQARGIEIAINELVALSPRLDKQAVETLSMAVEHLRKLVKKQSQTKD